MAMTETQRERNLVQIHVKLCITSANSPMTKKSYDKNIGKMKNFDFFVIYQ
jgi:hypothetical protein